MRILQTSDLHLTDKPRDRYRFGLFDWLLKQQRAHSPDATFVLGDLTDSKNHHSAELVNRAVDGFARLKPPVFILKGNHDYTDPNQPYFGFLNHLEGIHFITKVTEVLPGVWMIPHCGTQQELDAACDRIATKPVAVCLHGCFEGAIAETGARLAGLSVAPVEKLKPGAVWAGDIHKPQRVGRLLTYVGSPYHVRFGDHFNPRVLLSDQQGKSRDLHFDAPYKWSVTITQAAELKELNAREGDQIKVEVIIPPEGAATWAETKRSVLNTCKKLGLEVFGCTLKMPPRKAIQRQAVKTHSAHDVLTEFCRNEGVPDELANVGHALIE